MYMILKYLLPSTGDEKVLESAEVLKLDNGGWWCGNDRRDGKRSPSGGGDTAPWFGHVAFGARAWCPVRRASEHTAGKTGTVLRNGASARTREKGTVMFIR